VAALGHARGCPLIWPYQLLSWEDRHRSSQHPLLLLQRAVLLRQLDPSNPTNPSNQSIQLVELTQFHPISRFNPITSTIRPPISSTRSVPPISCSIQSVPPIRSTNQFHPISQFNSIHPTNPISQFTSIHPTNPFQLISQLTSIHPTHPFRPICQFNSIHPTNPMSQFNSIRSTRSIRAIQSISTTHSVRPITSVKLLCSLHSIHSPIPSLTSEGADNAQTNATDNTSDNSANNTADRASKTQPTLPPIAHRSKSRHCLRHMTCFDRRLLPILTITLLGIHLCFSASFACIDLAQTFGSLVSRFSYLQGPSLVLFSLPFFSRHLQHAFQYYKQSCLHQVPSLSIHMHLSCCHRVCRIFRSSGRGRP